MGVCRYTLCKLVGVGCETKPNTAHSVLPSDWLVSLVILMDFGMYGCR